jgi:hypothetical protein
MESVSLTGIPRRLGRGVALAFVLTVCASIAPAVSGAATSGSTSICTDFAPADACPQFAQHPTRIAVGTSGRMMLVRLVWSGWGGSTSTARGVLRENVGTARAARYTYRAMTVTASAIGPCDGLQVYEHLVIQVRGALRIH